VYTGDTDCGFSADVTDDRTRFDSFDGFSTFPTGDREQLTRFDKELQKDNNIALKK
jgi:hypothetical protein